MLTDVHDGSELPGGIDGGFLDGDMGGLVLGVVVADGSRIVVVAGGEEAKAKPKVTFEPGEPVKIVDGAFMASEGTVQSVDPDRGRLVVSVSILTSAPSPVPTTV